MNKRNVLKLSVLAAVSALPLLQGCTQDAGSDVAQKQAPLMMADDKDPSFDPTDPLAKPGSTLTTETLEVGDGWRKIHVYGTANDIDTGAATAVDRTLVVVQDKSKISGAPVPAFVKSDVTAELAAAPKLDPLPLGVAGKVVAPAPVDSSLIVDTVAAADLQAKVDSNAPIAMFSCSTSDKTVSKTISTTRSYTENKTFNDDFNGSLNATAGLTASATASATIEIKRKWCIPYGVNFKYAQVTGSAHVTATGKIDGSFAKNYHYEHTLAQPSLGSVSFTVGPIPVSVNFSAPIRVGIDASAKGTVRADGTAYADANFDMTCRTNGCTGSRSATTGFTPGSSPVVSVDGMVEATPYVFGGIHANLYYDWVAYGEVGLKAKLRNQLWGYAGNSCGDANGDGVPEFVSAAVVESRFGLDLVGKVGVVGSDYGPWSYNILDRHLKYWDLQPGGSTAASPIIAPSVSLGTTTVNASLKMRPCWPFADAMEYNVAWGDGSSNYTSYGNPATTSHAYAGYGVKTITATPIADTAGHTPASPTSRNVFVRPFIFNPIEVSNVSMVAE